MMRKCRRLSLLLALILIPSIALSITQKEIEALKKAMGKGAAPTYKTAIKRKVSAGSKPVSVNNLPLFGYSFFQKSTIETIQTLPVASDYVIGPGDVVLITIWGRINGQFRLQVTREGKIFIPNVGEFTIAGLTFQQMKTFIEQQIERITGAKAAVTLDRLRSIIVFVTGEVKRPGTYVLTPMNTIIDALIAAGGPTSIGSLRKIVLKRDSKIVQRVDLYELLLKGEKPSKIRLMHGDVVFVPPAGPRVSIEGKVKRPATYELKSEKKLIDIINLAGGLLPEAWKGRIQVERIVNHERKIVLDIKATNKKILNSFKVKDGDLIRVFPVLQERENAIYLTGNVKRPGIYSYREGMRVKDIIKSPEDLLPETFMEYALIKRLDPQTTEYEYKVFSLRKLFFENDERENLPLQPKDKIIVFNKKNIVGTKKVYIYGAVYKPGSYEWLPGMKVSDLVSLAGGLKRYAYYKAELVRKIPNPKGTITKIIKINIQKALEGDPNSDIYLVEDDALIIRTVPEWYETITVTIKGEVKFPGTYVVRKGERLSSLIRRAGGFTDKAYLRGAVFTRKSVYSQQERQLKEIISRLEQEVFASGAQSVSSLPSAEEAKIQSEQTKMMYNFIKRLKALKPTGRLVIQLAPPDQLEGTPYDIVLENGDSIYIPQKPATVFVQGAVFHPGAFVFMPNSNYEDYIEKAGGTLEDLADEDNIYILKVDGSAVRPNHGRTLSFYWNPEKHRWEKGTPLEIEPGDTIVVPYKLEKIAWLRNIKDITQILYQIAVTTGVLIVTF